MTKDQLIEYTHSLFEKIVKVNRTDKMIPATTITKVVDTGGGCLHLDGWGQYQLKSPDDVTVLSTDNAMKPIVKNMEVIVKKDYNTIKKDSKIIVEDFLDEEHTKIFTKGLTPGGWIDKKHVTVPLEPKGLRIKTIEELVRDYGARFIHLLRLSGSELSYLGNKVKDEWFFGSHVKADKKIHINKAILTNDEIPKNLIFYFKDLALIKSFHASLDGSGLSLAHLTNVAGKKVSEYKEISVATFPDKLRFVSLLSSGGYMTKCFTIRAEYIEIKEE